MLDERTLALLDIINQECQNSGYRIILIEDLLCSMPKCFNMDKLSLLDCIKALSTHEYISVKYRDEQEICVCPLIKGRLEGEKRIEREIDKIEHEKKYFFHAFLGAMLGGFIASAIAIVLKLVGGI